MDSVNDISMMTVGTTEYFIVYLGSTDEQTVTEEGMKHGVSNASTNYQ